jgi:hypothetical protein
MPKAETKVTQTSISKTGTGKKGSQPSSNPRPVEKPPKPISRPR